MCECTEFVKDNGFLICQGCGCKYTVEEAKKMMQDIDIEATLNDIMQDLENELENEVQDLKNELGIDTEYSSNRQTDDIPLHTPDSPNKLTATVVKVGHLTYTSASMVTLSALVGQEPQPVFVEGPDQVGHIGAQIELKNLAGKTIKYVTVYLTPFNAVGDPVSCSVQKHSEYGIHITGPIEVGGKWEGHLDGMWYNNSIVRAKITHIHVIYMDDTEELYDYSTNTAETDSSITRKITINRKQQFVNSALKMIVYKDGNEVCQLKTGNSYDFITDGNPFELRVAFKKDPKLATSVMVESGSRNLNFEVGVNSWSGKIVLQEI